MHGIVQIGRSPTGVRERERGEGGRAEGEEGSLCGFGNGGATMLAATTVATCPPSRLMLPFACGWTRLLKKITAVSLPGSIQMLVPVNPVWPKLPKGKNSPRLDENEVCTSHPSARQPSLTDRGAIIRRTVAGL